MEDSHIASPGLLQKEDSPVSLFGVFDGHGGKEVAKFVKLKYTDLLVGLESFKRGDYEAALRESFHGIDRLLEDKQFDLLLRELRSLPNPSDGKAAVKKASESMKLETKPVPDPSPIVRSPSPDDSKDDSDTDASPRSNPDDLEPLSNDEAVRMITELLEGARKYRQQGSVSPNGDSPVPVTETDVVTPVNMIAPGTTPSSFLEDDENEEDSDTEKDSLIKPFARASLGTRAQSKDALLLAANDRKEDGTRGTTNSPVIAYAKDDLAIPSNTLSRQLSKKELDLDIKEGLKGEPSDDKDSKHTEIAPAKDSPEDKKSLDVDDQEQSKSDAKLPIESKLSMENPGETIENKKDQKEEHHLDEDRDVAEELVMEITEDKSPIIPHLHVDTNDSKVLSPAPSPSPPPAPASVMTNGTLSCNLKDHRVLAGCTAIVALLVGKKLFVANAGDSRGVLMRNGVAVALSEDHKPTQERELNRIKAAGGYVNVVGRVNGNLNLSRSLGDLKYKQLKHLKPEEQIITAEPDITVIDIQEDDEFFILACDGIWDCLSNQAACDLVKEGLQNKQSLEEITNSVLRKCLADDPRLSQGIGGDNMTFLVVQFKH